AVAAEQSYPRHVGLDRRQLDAVVNLLRRLLFRGEGGRAMWAGIELGIDDVVRARLQGSADAGAALAWRLVAGRTIRLLALRRRQRRIVRRLRRPLDTASRFSSSAMRVRAASNCPTNGSSN